MCGRFHVDDTTVHAMEKMVRDLDRRMQKIRTGDIFPSQTAGILVRRDDGKAWELEDMRWGFAQYHKKGLLINARAETALERKMFRSSVLHRRCVIAAKHFYEWDAQKNKVAFFREESPVVYMAGFYNRFADADCFIILTTQANASVCPVHERMPLILDEGELDDWVCDGRFMEYAFRKKMPALGRVQEYEQQSLF